LAYFWPHIDGNWVDLGTIIVAMAFGVIRFCQAGPGRAILDRQTRKDFLDGTAIFPLLVLAGSFASTDLTRALMQSNRLILSIAGFVALIAILED